MSNGAMNAKTVKIVAFVAATLLVGSLTASATASRASVARRQAIGPVPAFEVFVSVTPVRVFDTRVPIGTAAAGPLTGGLQVDLPLTSPAPNRSFSPLPADATAAVLNVTIDADATKKAFLTIWPTGQPRPITSANNAEPGLVSPNESIARLGTGGSVSMYLQTGAANVVIDVVGYLVPATDLPTTAPPPPAAYSFGTDNAGISLAPFTSTSLTGEFGYGPEQVVFTVPSLPVGDYLLQASVSFSKLPDGVGGAGGATNDMDPQCWWSSSPNRRFSGFNYAFAPDSSYPISVSVTGRIQGASSANLICRYGLTDADDSVGVVRDLPLDVGAIAVNVTSVTLAVTG